MKFKIPRVNPKVNYGVWVIMVCQCRFTVGNKCTTLVSDTDNGKGYACVGAEDTWEISAFGFPFCWQTNAAIKYI